MIKIYCLDNSELTEFEASSRGYRSDIFVKTIASNIYQLHVYDIIRLQQDFETEIDSYGFFGIDPNIILVKEVLLSNIKLTIIKLFAQHFFDYLKPIEQKKIDINTMIEI
jgi:hypothetical protein